MILQMKFSLAGIQQMKLALHAWTMTSKWYYLLMAASSKDWPSSVSSRVIEFMSFQTNA